MGPLDLSKSTIYIADDEPANRSLLQAILTRGGLPAATAFADGGSLLAAIEIAEPDLVLLDMRMPGMGGQEVIEALRSRRSDSFLPVLVLSAEDGPAARHRALEAGANDYVTKPFDPREVLLRARNLLETRHLHSLLADRNVDLVGQVETTSRNLADREREWGQQATSLSSLLARETPEATADAICREMARLPGVASVILAVLDAAGNGVPLGHTEGTDIRIAVNRPLAGDLLARWRERVDSGPWVGRPEAVFGPSLNRQPHAERTGLAIIPLRTGTDLLGAIVLSTELAEGPAYLASRLPVYESFGAVAAALLAPDVIARQHTDALRLDIDEVLEAGAFWPVFQPVVALGSEQVVGFEALTRFDDGARPDRRFADASAVGLGLELELASLKAAISAAVALPSDAWLSVNVSPELVLAGSDLRTILRAADRPIVLEVTEHVPIDDYPAFRAAAAALGSGLRFAVDDAGAGFASFRHIVELNPDFVKLDIELVRRIDRDAIRQALVAGIVFFARKSGCQLIAEGIETLAERATLRSLGVDLGQGYLLGRPKPPTSQQEHPTAATARQQTVGRGANPTPRSVAPARR
jgi:EAL domain-containing protein (putative c-di-GMP-specific phosphodiesterase class I)/CheY-like chemotaxis protein